MRPTRSELDHGVAPGRCYYPRGFRGDGRLESDGRQQIGFHQLCFDQGSTNREKRLACEQGRAFTHGEHIAGKAQSGQHVEKLRGRSLKLRQRSEKRDLGRSEPKIPKIFDRLRQADRQNKIAVPGQTAHEQFKSGTVASLACLKEARGHGELIQVRIESRTVTRLVRHYFFFPSLVGGGGGGSRTP